ncbi:MAG: transposase [Phycisphaerae bacterium]
MGKSVRRSTHSPVNQYWNGRHRFEHWYVSNQVYFITARTRDRAGTFRSEEAKQIFWDRFEHYTKQNDFVPWICSLVDNHYHVLGYLRKAEGLPMLMQRLHGSVAKLVNDTLEERHLPFWSEKKGKEYFDGCIRSEKQCRRACRYTLLQGVQTAACDVGKSTVTRGSTLMWTAG